MTSYDIVEGRKMLKIGTKGPNDCVSEVDRAAEDIIIFTMREAYPGHGILTQESGRARTQSTTAHAQGRRGRARRRTDVTDTAAPAPRR